MGRLYKILSNERGSIAAMVAMIMLVMLAIAGLIIDSGFLVYNQLRLDEATNKAATAIVRSVDETASSASNIVFDEEKLLTNSDFFLRTNAPDAVLTGCEIDPEDNGVVYISAKLKSKVHFSKIFGVKEFTLTSKAIGKVSKQTE
tara:strand:+ start:874 stop:1308 length:435 start_codon:yes stop_codon:yes gene_type:complete